MATMQLPDEILTEIFDLAADEDVIFQYGLPTVMAEAAWFRNVMGEWALRSPREAINTIQRRSYATKKAIMLTCKSWRRLGSEFLYRCLFFDNPAKLHLLCEILETHAKAQKESENPSVGLGWWTKRIHLSHYYVHVPNKVNPAKEEIAQEDMCTTLTTIIKHCPNLSIFIVEGLMPSRTFGLVADSLFKYTRKALHTVHWRVPAECIPKVIWALDSLSLVLSAHIEFEPATATTELHESLHLGSAQDITLDLPYLQQLHLRGSFAEFLEQASGWNLPGLRNISFDSGINMADLPDIIGFLEEHGEALNFLDLDSVLPVDVPEILDLCPQLEVFSFNADWRFQTPTLPAATGDDEVVETSNHRRRQSNTMRLSLGSQNEMSILTHTPHPRIHTIGLHGLLHAFGVGHFATSRDPLRSRLVRRSNDLNFAALNRVQFPHLRCVRVLNHTLLNNLNAEDGPKQNDETDGMERWEKWWNGCSVMGVRLEDCTGGELGRLPDDEDAESEDEGDGSSTEESEDEDEDEWEYEVPPMDGEEDDDDDDDNDRPHVRELRQLLKECQDMAEDRDDSSPFAGATSSKTPV